MSDFICGNDIPPMRVVEDNNVDLIHSNKSNSSNNNSGQVNSCPDSFIIDTDECLVDLDENNIFYNLIKNWNKMSIAERMLCYIDTVYYVHPLDMNVKRSGIDEYVNNYIIEKALETGKMIKSIHFEITNNAIPAYALVFAPVNYNHKDLDYDFKKVFIKFGVDHGFIEKNVWNPDNNGMYCPEHSNKVNI